MSCDSCVADFPPISNERACADRENRVILAQVEDVLALWAYRGVDSEPISLCAFSPCFAFDDSLQFGYPTCLDIHT